jgi:hypothetical protein
VEQKRSFLFKSAQQPLQVLEKNELESYVRACQEDNQTGFIEIGYPKGAYALFGLLMVRGQLVNAYRFDDPALRLPESDWFEHAASSLPSFGLRTLSLTPHAMRLVKIMVEQYRGGRAQWVHSGLLETTVAKWQESAKPVLLHLAWPGADGLAFLPGGGLPPHQTLFLAADQVQHSAGGMSALYGWKESQARLRVYTSQSNGPAWDEYLLHLAFAWQVSHLFRRFEELTGRLLVNTLVREMNFSASAHGWNITVSAHSLTDQALFPSPGQAWLVYQRLFEIISQHAELILGGDLLSMLLREAQNRLYAPYRAVYERYAATIALEKILPDV